MDSENDEESQDAQVINVIPVHFDETFEELGESSPHASTPGVAKSKYYKQTYRTAWEEMPDFNGWLTGVEGQPNRAYCLYCEKTLHAHRLSLLKHTCTIRHQKAAQIHNLRKKREDENTILVNMNEEHIMGGGEGIESFIEQSEVESNETQEEEVKFSVEEHTPKPMTSTKPPISTHVLDTTRGLPIAGLQVSLYKLIGGRWTYMNEGLTSVDGRFAGFLQRGNFTAGRYKLHFDVDRFFESKNEPSLYPFIEIVFDCHSASDHYHIPLLLSPYGYTTYRGS